MEKSLNSKSKLVIRIVESYFNLGILSILWPARGQVGRWFEDFDPSQNNNWSSLQRNNRWRWRQHRLFSVPSPIAQFIIYKSIKQKKWNQQTTKILAPLWFICALWIKQVTLHVTSTLSHWCLFKQCQHEIAYFLSNQGGPYMCVTFMCVTHMCYSIFSVCCVCVFVFCICVGI